MDNFVLALGVLAGLVQLAGYRQYHQVMSSHDGHKPSTASWFMWGVGGVTELIVYAALVEDRSKEILPAVCAVVVIITFLRVWRQTALNMDRRDWVIVTFDGAVVAFWFITKNPFASNALLGIDMILSFWPILRDTWRNPASEHPRPWRTWTLAYGLLILVVILQWENGWELIYPVLYLVLHGAVWYLSSAKNTRTAVI